MKKIRNILSVKPKLFISYSREDFNFVQELNTLLQTEGYLTFFDTESIHIGDVFPEKIVTEIKNSDGIILVISRSSIESDWCKFESYTAHFFQKIIIPLKFEGNENYHSIPLSFIQKDINYFLVEKETELTIVLEKIKNKLNETKLNAKKKKLNLLYKVIFSSSLIIILIFFLVNRIDYFEYNNKKKQFVAEFNKTDKILNSSEIDFFKEKFKNDKELASDLIFQAFEDDKASSTKINSRIIASQIFLSHNIARYQYFQEVNWVNSFIENSFFNNSSFLNGDISNVSFKNVQFNDIFFKGLNEVSTGIGFSGSNFNNCNFNAVSFNKNQLMKVEFKSCRFQGSRINTTNFSFVIFESDSVDSPFLVESGKVMSFENCLFENERLPDPPGVLVLGKETEIQFRQVVFEGCIFKGFLRPEWFHKCSFKDCYFESNEIMNQIMINNFFYPDNKLVVEMGQHDLD